MVSLLTHRLLLALLVSSWIPFSYSVLSEQERMRRLEYDRHGFTWPLETYIPNTKGWRELNERRFRQVSEIDDREQRYEGYANTLSSALTQPNFTEFGFGLARAPENLMEALRQGIQDGLAAGPRIEHDIPIIEGYDSWFIDRPDLTQRVLNELQHWPEAWTGIELTPVIAYGFRLYRNNTHLNMHLDKPMSHIISFILHIDSSADSEPWPIAIEDFNGNTHEVVLTSGDMLLYESSKCLHGRPRKFQGSWYTSVFVHYLPKFFWDDGRIDHNQKRFAAIPPHWDDPPTTTNEIPLEMVGSSFKEPTCPHNWCNTETSIKWKGPGEEGYWIAPNGEKYPLEPKKLPCEDWHDKCPFWASLETDECRNNISFMLSRCKKSCGACSVESDQHAEL